MKKPIWIAFGYAIAAMACGVFYREFTKFFDFTGTTTLAVSHVHLFMLGAVIFLAVALFNSKLQLDQTKLWKPFLIVYNIGLPFMVVMFLVRGIMQVVGFDDIRYSRCFTYHLGCRYCIVFYYVASGSGEKAIA